MALDPNLNTREQQKFGRRNGRTFVREASINDNLYNTIDYVKTTVTTTATKIDFPEDANEFILFHEAPSTLYINKDNTVSSSDIPIYSNDTLEVGLKKNNNNEIYGIASSGSIDVFVIGAIKQ